jgi:hypothetical protein
MFCKERCIPYVLHSVCALSGGQQKKFLGGWRRNYKETQKTGAKQQEGMIPLLAPMPTADQPPIHLQRLGWVVSKQHWYVL